MRGRGAIAAVLAAFGLAAVPARAADSLAPPGAPPHWLPNESWAHEHWLPYDETRLYALLHVTRGELWRQLRDDTRNVAELAARHGWPNAQKLAAALVAPRARSVSAAQLALLRSRALRTLTQGHLAQHLFFHSLHEWAVPDQAPKIFGSFNVAQYQRQRRDELSPVMICHVNGRSLAQTQAAVIATLRQEAAEGVNERAMTAAQARILLARQLAQVPRWLQQSRYNGPPPLYRNPKAVKTARVYANDPALAAGGGQVVFDSYRVNPKQAKVQGEIAMIVRDLGSGRSRTVQLPPMTDGKPDPSSAYNPAISADGRYVAFEASAGNLNFAKRYGRIVVFRRDLRTGRTVPVSRPAESAYTPSISADGRYVAYESSRPKPGRPDAYRILVYVRDMRTGETRLVSRATGAAGAGADGDVYEPRISGDGRFVVFTSVAHNLGHGRAAGLQSRVYVRDLRRDRTTLVSRADDDAYEPRITPDGRHVAFTSLAGNLGGGPAGVSRVYVHDFAAGTTQLASGRTGAASQPGISADGRYVTFVSTGRLVRHASAQPLVYRRDMVAGETTLVSRAGGPAGDAANGTASEPSISADGRFVAFTSDASNLAHTGGHLRAVFVRDLARHRTLLAGPALARAIVPVHHTRRWWLAALIGLAILGAGGGVFVLVRRRARPS
jgi:Tol biopolymer transport system component